MRPSLVATPRLVGLDVPAATAAVERARLRLRVVTTRQELTPDRALLDRVVVRTQSIPDGRLVEPGAEVDVSVVRYIVRTIPVNPPQPQPNPIPPPQRPSIVGTWAGEGNLRVSFAPNGVFRSRRVQPRAAGHELDGKHILDGLRITLEIGRRTERGEARFEGPDRLLLNVGPFRSVLLVRARESR